MHLTFKAFRAVNEPEICAEFKQEHSQVLRDYGITNITTNTETWRDNPNIYCVVARQMPGNKIVGGVRIEISTEKTFLPVELAVGKMDRKIYSLVKNLREQGGVGELSALWNAKAVAGMGVSTLLARAIIAASSQMPVNTLLCICAEYTLQLFKNVGFEANNSLGEKGVFPYPNSTYTARILSIKPHTLDCANEQDKERILSLRTNPVQTFKEKGVAGEIEAEYDLVIKK